jgi:hypothetical protein
MVLASPLQGTFGSERSAEDILAGRLRLRLASQWFVLPVLTVGENADWLASLEQEFADVVNTDEDDLAQVMEALAKVDGRLLELVYAYDKHGVLPPLESIARDVYPHEVLRAVMEVRLAANPTVGFGLAMALAELRTSPSPAAPAPSPRTSSSRRRTGGRTARSAKA